MELLSTSCASLLDFNRSLLIKNKNIMIISVLESHWMRTIFVCYNYYLINHLREPKSARWVARLYWIIQIPIISLVLLLLNYFPFLFQHLSLSFELESIWFMLNYSYFSMYFHLLIWWFYWHLFPPILQSHFTDWDVFFLLQEVYLP